MHGTYECIMLHDKKVLVKVIDIMSLKVGRYPVLGTRKAPNSQSARKRGFQSYNHMELCSPTT